VGRVLAEAFRVLRPGGTFLGAITLRVADSLIFTARKARA
jgi:ubiquinone/menaquinone biosynthesis C-methylase UbiE